MKNSTLELVVLYIIVGIFSLAIAALLRELAISAGFSSFTGFIVFIIVLAIAIATYITFHLVIEGLILPFIRWILFKIPYFRNKMKNDVSDSKTVENIVGQPSLEDERSKQRHHKEAQQNEKLNIALEYTRRTFALYASDKDIEVLCENLKLYADKLSLEFLQSINVSSELSTLDIYHFGWNIWNYFGRVRTQIDVAHFLKKTFPDILKDAEVGSIKSHLKDDEQQGIIKIQKKL